MTQANRAVISPLNVMGIDEWKSRLRHSKADLPLTDRLLSANALADKLGVSRSTIYRWLNDGTLPEPKRKGRTVRWSENEIDKWWDNAPKDGA